MQTTDQANVETVATEPKPQAAQPIPSAETVAAITNADAAKRKALAAKLAAKREAAAGSKPSAKPAKASGKRGTKAAKPATPATKADTAKREAARIAAQRDADAMRTYAARYYAGASLAAHKSRPASRADYISRATNPVQKPANGNPSQRDESGLALILSKAKAGAFDPCAINFDLGILSRLSALGFVSYSAKADAFTLTKTGAERARIVAKRAA